MLRYDAVLMVGSRDQVERFEAVFERPIQRLSDLDAALDDYAEKARAAGRLGGMKSALPYQRRVDFEQSSFADAERAFEAMMQGRQTELRPLHDYLFHRFVQRAREFGLPVQLHTGYLAGNWGNPGQGNPELLVPVFRRYRGVRFDMFHAGWPYSEVAGAIAKAFPNVYLDMCWAWTMNPAQMERILERVALGRAAQQDIRLRRRHGEPVRHGRLRPAGAARHRQRAGAQGGERGVRPGDGEAGGAAASCTPTRRPCTGSPPRKRLPPSARAGGRGGGDLGGLLGGVASAWARAGQARA